MQIRQLSNQLFLLGITLGTACVTSDDVTPDPDEEVGVNTSEIHGNWSSASAFHLARAVKVPGCTGTRISPRHVITAAHCGVNVGGTVKFYTSGPGFEDTLRGRVEAIARPSGLNVTACETDGTCIDGNGNFADMAILTISSDSDDATALAGQQATLAWRYPGDSVGGYKVGAGGHSGNSNSTGALRQVYDTTDDSDHSGGYFVTSEQDTDDGDSGGPFYASQKIIGVLWGRSWDIGDGYYAKYTSVPYRLNWILDQIGYKWQGQPKQSNTMLSGSTIDTILTSNHQVCQYACEKTSSCEGYMFNPSMPGGGQCILVDNVSGTSTGNGFTSALKHGNRSGQSGDVTGYVRSDGFNAVVHKHGTEVNELYLSSTGWEVGTISGEGPPVASKVSGYRRADGTNAVIYRSTENRIIELALVGGLWKAYDLTNTSGAVAAVGNPVAYIGADGLSAVIYRSSNGHINELRQGTRNWIFTDLTAQAGVSHAASSDPSAYARSDGYSSVVYRAGTAIYELYKAPGGVWVSGGPSNLANAPAAASRPFGYRHHDGINVIVYRSTANQLVELWVDSTGWHYGVVGSNASGDPVGNVRNDAIDTILTRSGSQIHELTNTPWQTWNLSNTGLSTAFSDPTVFQRADGVTSVLTHIANNDVAEVFYRRGFPWGWANLSAGAGE